MKAQNEQEMKAFLKTRAKNLSVDDFAQHILRNYSIEQCKLYGNTAIEQAYTILCNNFKKYGGADEIEIQQ